MTGQVRQHHAAPCRSEGTGDGLPVLRLAQETVKKHERSQALLPRSHLQESHPTVGVLEMLLR